MCQTQGKVFANIFEYYFWSTDGIAEQRFIALLI